MHNKKGIQKNIIIGIIVIAVVVIIAIFIFRGGSEEGSSTTQSSGSVSNEEQKYAEFEAELTCELLGAASTEDIVGVMGKTASVMEKYGYDDAEYNILKTKYASDDDFKALIVSEMGKTCPELVNQVSP